MVKAANYNFVGLKLLVKMEANVNFSAWCGFNWSALHMAASNGDLEIVKYLLKHDVDRYFCNTDHCNTFVDTTFHNRHIEMANYLLECE